MISISVGHELAQLGRAVGAEQKRLEVAAQRAIVKTANRVLKKTRDELPRVFDRPTRYTLNAFKVVVDKPNLAASVEVKRDRPRADHYLDVQISGGKRNLKAFEVALMRRGLIAKTWRIVPGQRARMDAYGNMSAGHIREILSWFDAAEQVQGSTQNLGEKGRAKRRKGTKRRRSFEYFAAGPALRQTRRQISNRLQPGIYKRTWFSFTGPRGGRLQAIEPVMIFVKAAKYRKRFDFYGMGQRVVDAEFGAELRKAFERG